VRPLPWLLLLFLVGSQLGCASAKLQLHVDLYDEDPRVDRVMSPEEVQKTLADVQSLETSAVRERQIKTDLANRSLEIYASAWALVGGDPNELDALRLKRAAYVEALAKPKKEFEQEIESLRKLLRDYIDEYSDKYELAAKGQNRNNGVPQSKLETNGIANNKARKCKSRDGCTPSANPIKKLGRLIRQPYSSSADSGDEKVIKALPLSLKVDEHKIRSAITKLVGAYWRQREAGVGYQVNWLRLEHLLRARQLQAAKYDRLHELQLWNEFAETLYSQVSVLRSQIDVYAGVQPAASAATLNSPSNLFESAAAIGAELETLRNDLPSNSTSRTALNGLVAASGQFFQLIDRLQDAGDPVWRTVSDPANKAHWNTQFAKTYFKAKGDTDVVIVRDNPMRFRVQNGSNNPTALIQGQLVIARSVTNAALSVAGAAAGIPTAALASSGTQSNNSAAGESGDVAFQKRKAEVEQFSRLRAATHANLRRSLERAKSQLLAAGEKDGLGDEQAVLLGLLKGHKKALQAVTGEGAP